MKKFICKHNSTNYYTESDGAGGFLNPPGDAEHNYSITGYRGGHLVESVSLRYALENEYYPRQVKHMARYTLKCNQGTLTDEWVKDVYKYFAHCYSKDGINRNVNDCLTFGKFWNNAEKESEQPAEYHLAYLFIKSFFPEYPVRRDLMGR